ncbi:MAG: hypothetical protein KAH97_10195 [Anaerolineales bacterium]|nr:hypothetical protein [Anaerolineales bacterium]
MHGRLVTCVHTRRYHGEWLSRSKKKWPIEMRMGEALGLRGALSLSYAQVAQAKA